MSMMIHTPTNIALAVGSPVMRPLVYEFEHDDRVWEESFDFMLGSSILVANVLEPGARTRRVYLPLGCDWIDWTSGERYAGGQEIELPVSLDSIPMFIRSGSIVPMAEGLMNIHHDTVEELKLLVEPSQNASFVLYDDDGVTNGYKQGEYLKTTINVEAGSRTELSFAREGRYRSPLKRTVVELLCYRIAPVQVELEGRKLPMFLNGKDWEASEAGWYYDMERKAARIKYALPEGDYSLHADFGVKDLISI